MHAKVIFLRVQPGKVEEAARIMQEDAIPAAKKLPGFQAAHLLKGPHTDKLIYLTLWETDLDLQVDETEGFFRDQVARVLSLLAESPVYEVYTALI